MAGFFLFSFPDGWDFVVLLRLQVIKVSRSRDIVGKYCGKIFFQIGGELRLCLGLNHLKSGLSGSGKTRRSVPFVSSSYLSKVCWSSGVHLILSESLSWR